VRSTVRGQAPRSTTFQSTRTFAFDAAFAPACDTVDVFETEVLPLVELVASGGGNCCVMAYGATGSGKTHTLTGSFDRWLVSPVSRATWTGTLECPIVFDSHH
jgi:centromeric protein E